jgi:cytochrome P450
VALRYLADPYSVYAEFRSRARVLWERRLGCWIVVGYEDVVEGLHDAKLSSVRPLPSIAKLGQNDRIAARTVHERTGAWLLRMDPPDHTRLRTVVNTAFTSRHVNTLRPRIVKRVDRLLDFMHGADQVDLMRAFANPLALGVIADMIGVPDRDCDTLVRWSDDVARMLELGPQDGRAVRSLRSLDAADQYVCQLIDERRREPRDDFVSRLLQMPESSKLNASQISSVCTLILLAGRETTANMIGCALLALLNHRDEFQRLRRGPKIANEIVDELIRFNTPLQGVLRFPVSNTVVAGQHITAGQPVLLSLGAANHDPARFPNPDRLDIGRRPGVSHLGFGHGGHYCLGAGLARTILEVSLTAILARLPSLRLANDVQLWEGNFLFRGLSALLVRPV